MRSSVLLLLPWLAFAGEKTVEASQVPAAVVKAATDRYPKAKVTKYTEETKGAKKGYEVELDVAGQKVEVMVAADGTLEAEERTLTLNDLPVAVAKALAASKYSKAAVRSVERIEELRTKGPLMWELSVELGGKKRELLFDEAGALKKDKAD